MRMAMLWWRFGHQAVRSALSSWIVLRGEDFDEADPVWVYMTGRGVDVGGVVEIDEFGFGVKAEDLDPSRERFVSDFLIPPAVQLFLIPARRIAHRDPANLGDVYVGEAVGFDGFVVEPGAIARFPLEAADHAEFGAAATGHVVATFLQLDGCGAVETALPSFFFRDLDELLRGGVFGAFAAGVPFIVACAAHFRLASLTLAEFSASVGTTTGIHGNMGGFNP